MKDHQIQERKYFDAIVVGAGIMGSCAAYQIAKRGKRTLLLEQFDFLHYRGSSHGESRTIRATYPEPYYSSMAIESAQLWEEAQSESGYKVYFPTRQLDMGPAHDSSLRAVIDNCCYTSTNPDNDKGNGNGIGRRINCRVLRPDEVVKELSGLITLPEDWVGVLSDLGGVIKPTKAVSMFQALALKNGAVLKDNTEVASINKKTITVHDNDNGHALVVTTANGIEFHCKKCIVTAGAWTKRLIETVSTSSGSGSGQSVNNKSNIPIQPLETTILYWKVKKGHERDFSIEAGFPTFASYGFPYIYGTPSLEYPGLIKVGLHAGRPCNPDDRTWAPLEGSVDRVKTWLRDRFSGALIHVDDQDRPVVIQSCMYSMTPDEDFVLDFLGGGDFGQDVVLAGGFSGHGFKMGPVIGRVLADLALNGNAEGVELDHFRLSRFNNNPKGNLKGFAEQVAQSLPLMSKY